MLTRERMRELIDEYGLSDRSDELIADACPSIHLKPRYDVDDADMPIGASRLGGSPDVPEGFEFPTWNDRYLSFIAQIRLADAMPYDLEGLLPPTGMLYFFFEFSLYCEHITSVYYTPEGPYRVIYMEDETKPLVRMPHPVSEYALIRYANKPLLVQTEVYKPCALDLEQEWTPRSAYHQSSRQLRGAPRENDAAWDWFRTAEDELARPMHRLLGAETDIQGDFSTLDYASKAWKLGTGADWTLLLQVDSDEAGQPKPGFRWVDGGLLYFCIHKDDLRERRFDRVWLDLIDP
jgi:uncharacterized protein YwqG